MDKSFISCGKNRAKTTISMLHTNESVGRRIRTDRLVSAERDVAVKKICNTSNVLCSLTNLGRGHVRYGQLEVFHDGTNEPLEKGIKQVGLLLVFV